MKYLGIIKLVGGIAGVILFLLVIGWFAFVPFAQEPPYSFVKGDVHLDKAV